MAKRLPQLYYIKMEISFDLGFITYVQKCMQWRKWRNWRKIASCWRFELDAKSGPLEAGDFGETGDFGKNRHACNGETGEKSPASGDLNWMPKVAPWRLAILAKLAMWQNIQIGCQKWPLQRR